MSKGNMFLGYARGKVGSLVFARRNGEQVTRAYNGSPKDAKSVSQGKQRSSITNIVRLYQSTPSFFQKAFEGKKMGLSDYNMLVSINMKRAPKVYLPKNIADNGGGVAAPYRITQGSLQAILVTGEGVDAVTNIAIGTDFEISAATTVAQLSQAILDNNTFIMEGDQLSYLSIEQYTDGSTPRLRARKYEMQIDTTLAIPVYNYLPIQAVANVGGFIGHGEMVYSGAFAWVLSRIVDSTLKVSTQDLIVTSSGLYSTYSSGSAATRAAESYGAIELPFLNPDGEGGSSTTPSNRPSIAAVQIEGVTLVPGEGTVSVASGSIPAGKFVVAGSALAGVSKVHAVFTGTDSLDVSSRKAEVDIPVTVTGDTKLANTSEIDLGEVAYVEKLTISIDNRQVYSWTGSDGGDDGETDDPLA